jgi:phosphoglycolate phosphatase-like HAD superfamily hydrolase
MTQETPFIHEYLPLDLLEAHLERYKDVSQPLALIDIDSTVLDTGPRNIAILHEALDEMPRLREILHHITPENLGWNVPDAVAERLSLSDRERKLLWTFWRERFFDDAYLHHDQPYPGVAELLRLLSDRGMHLIYLTGRDSPNMAEGTLASFKQHNLPFRGEEDFIFKPQPDEADLVFKERALSEVAARGELVIALENEPANANRMQRRFPDALVLLIETITTPNPEAPDPDILRFRHYPVVDFEELTILD